MLLKDCYEQIFYSSIVIRITKKYSGEHHYDGCSDMQCHVKMAKKGEILSVTLLISTHRGYYLYNNILNKNDYLYALIVGKLHMSQRQTNNICLPVGIKLQLSCTM